MTVNKHIVQAKMDKRLRGFTLNKEDNVRVKVKPLPQLKLIANANNLRRYSKTLANFSKTMIVEERDTEMSIVLIRTPLFMIVKLNLALCKPNRIQIVLP